MHGITKVVNHFFHSSLNYLDRTSEAWAPANDRGCRIVADGSRSVAVCLRIAVEHRAVTDAFTAGFQ